MGLARGSEKAWGRPGEGRYYHPHHQGRHGDPLGLAHSKARILEQGVALYCLPEWFVLQARAGLSRMYLALRSGDGSLDRERRSGTRMECVQVTQSWVEGLQG